MYQLYLNNHLKLQFLVTFHLSSCNNVSIVCYFFSKKVRGLHIVYIELSKKSSTSCCKKTHHVPAMLHSTPLHYHGFAQHTVAQTQHRTTRVGTVTQHAIALTRRNRNSATLCEVGSARIHACCVTAR